MNMEVDDNVENEDRSNFRPRPYQDQLCELAIQKNSIIYLPTGAGKTFIAILVMKHMCRSLHFPLAEGGKRTIFLVNTVVLSHQQAHYISNVTGLRTSKYSGDMNVDAWQRDKWYSEFENSQVLVATCQIILDVIRHGFISFKHINLIIMDECHHGMKEHPMRQLMSLMSTVPKTDQPRVLGLTGMLLDAKVKYKNVIENLEKLEIIFQSSIVTVKTIKEFSNVLLYSTNPTEELILFEYGTQNQLTEYITMYVTELCIFIDSYPVNDSNQGNSPLKTLRKIWKDFLYQLEDMGIFGGSVAILSVMVDLELKKRSTETTALRNLIRYLITCAEYIRHKLALVVDEDKEEHYDETTILSNSTPKLKKLILYLKKMALTKEIKCLVFVERKYTAKIIYHILKELAYDTEKYRIRPDFMVGSNAIPESIEAILDCKTSRKVVERFKKNHINLIVATNVLEEGVDLQMCNLVVTYDRPKSYRSYVQSKGRARMIDSTYCIFTAIAKHNALIADISEFKKIDGALKEYLIGKAIDRPLPSEEDIGNEFSDASIKPYKTKIGAILEACSAVSLLNRYCMILPNDMFTVSSVIWRKESTANKRFIVCVTLPIQSTVREEIRSDEMTSLRNAKRSAAFKACVCLHQNGELNDHLYPMNRFRTIEKVKDVYFTIFNNYPNDDPKLAGTHKSVRTFKMNISQHITGCLPKLTTITYLYLIHFQPKFNDNNPDKLGCNIFYNLYKSNRSYGILTSKKLPNIAATQFYITLGEITCTLIEQPIEIIFKGDELVKLNKLRKFHVVLFKDILKVYQEYLVTDYADEENSYIIVPTINDCEIDWIIVNDFQQFQEQRELDVSARKQLIFKPEDYLYNVISPWYRDTDARYVVIKIHEYLTPYSQFPSNSYPNYVDYFKDKYKKNIVNGEQFLMEVKGITTHLNRLHPGTGDFGGMKTVSFRGPELLIPELCHNYKFPGALWLKATILPSFLHRFQYLLNAEDLRISIKNYLKMESFEPYKPLPLKCSVKRRKQNDKDDDENDGDLNGEDSIVKVQPAKSIIIPNPEYTPVKKIDGNDIIASHSYEFPWQESDEPIDIYRNLVSIYQVDIDYYQQFITKDRSELSIATNNVSNNYQRRLQPTPNNLPAICDVNEIDKMNLKLLKINLINAKLPEQSELITALTTNSSNDIIDMERYETLGDAFLKFSVSLYLLHNHPEWHEGFLTAVKGKIISNRNLCYLGIKNNIPNIMKVARFDPKNDWQPPLFCVPKVVKNYLLEHNLSAQLLCRLSISDQEFDNGDISHITYQDFLNSIHSDEKEHNLMLHFLSKQSIHDKNIADCVEAILGVCLTSLGIEKCFSLLQYFNILPTGTENLENILKIPFKSPRIHPNISDKDIDEYLMNYRVFEEKIKYKFNDRAYLLQALTHPSFPTNRLTDCYQQLEFLGDAVLDLLITAYIYENCPYMDPGQLTDLRSALVNNVTLACLCVRYNLHVHILSQSAVLTEIISKFVTFQENHNHSTKDQVQLLIEESDVSIAEHIDVPKILGDVFEAVIGAIFLDSGNNLEITWKVIYTLMYRELHEFMANVPIQLIRRLYEYPGANPKFDDPIVEDDILYVTVRFTRRGEILEVSGFGQNSESAKKAAAKLALHKLTSG